MVKASRRQFLKGVLAGTFGAALTAMGAVRAEPGPESEEGPYYTLEPLPIQCMNCGRELQEGEAFTTCMLCEYDTFGMLLCPECQEDLFEIRGRVILEAEQVMAEIGARLNSLRAEQAAMRFPIPEGCSSEPIIEGLTIPRRVLHEGHREFEGLDQIISTGYVDIQTDEPCPACEQVKLSMGYTVSVHNLNDPGCRMASWGYEFGEDAKSEGLRFKQGVLADGSAEWSIEPDHMAWQGRKSQTIRFGDRTQLFVASPNEPGKYDYVDDVYEFRLDEDWPKVQPATIEDLPDADFTLEPAIRGCKNWRMVHGVPVCEDDAIGIRVDGKDVISSAIPVHEIGNFQHEGPRWKVEGVAWRFDENRAKVPISINEVHRFKALDGVEPTWAWGLDEAPVVTPETIEAMAGKDTILCFDGCPKNAEWFKYEQSIDGWVLTVRMSHFFPLGSSLRVDQEPLFSEKGFVRSFVRDLSGPIAMYTYEIVEPFVFFEGLDDTFQVWAKYLHYPRQVEMDVLDHIKQSANWMGSARWLGTMREKTFCRVHGNCVQAGDIEGDEWIVRHSVASQPLSIHL